MTRLVNFSPGVWFTELTIERPVLSVRGAVLVGDQRAVVWDTLCRPIDMQPVIPLISGHPFMVVYSHADWDHCWGTAGLPAAAVIAHAAARERFARDVRETLVRMRAEDPAAWTSVTLVPPTLSFTAALTLDLGGLTCELHSLPGHTADSLVAFVPEIGLLLGGDAVEDPFPFLSLPEALPSWAAALEHWASDPRVKVVAPAHGPLHGPDLLQRNLAYLRSLLRGEDIMPPTADPDYLSGHTENLRVARQR